MNLVVKCKYKIYKLTCRLFWIYWLDVNTKFTNWHVVNFVLTPTFYNKQKALMRTNFDRISTGGWANNLSCIDVKEECGYKKEIIQKYILFLLLIYIPENVGFWNYVFDKELSLCHFLANKKYCYICYFMILY